MGSVMGNFNPDVQLGTSHTLRHASLDHYELVCRVTGDTYQVPIVGAIAFREAQRLCPLCYAKLEKPHEC